jgi:hypothetical protein
LGAVCEAYSVKWSEVDNPGASDETLMGYADTGTPS